MPFKKINKEPVADTVYNALHREIVGGRFREGDKLPSEGALAGQFGVSKATVKAALSRLNALHLVETKNGQGSFVCAISPGHYLDELAKFLNTKSGISEITEYRLYTEMASTQLAIQNAAEEDFKTMEVILDKMDQAVKNNDIALHGDLDYQFHLAICRATGNRIFVLAYEVIELLLRQHTTILNVEFFRKYANNPPHEDVHRRLLRAIKQKDIDACYTLYVEMFAVFD